ncbi:hypothetical protein AB6805_29620 [Chitinophaga sp. RCC_12]|uniref:hypothetical protein n=1 Tax=Chitinophaga sp. RCC_12 TaxID=3239226 RepID=UPI003523C6F7
MKSDVFRHLIPNESSYPSVCVNCGNNPKRKALQRETGDYIFTPYREIPRHLLQVTKLYPWLNLDNFNEEELDRMHRIILMRPAKGDLNRRTFLRFLKYHSVYGTSPYGTSRIFLGDGIAKDPHKKDSADVPPTSIRFLDDGYVLIAPAGKRYTLSVRFVESRVFYRKLAAYIALPHLDVTDRL